MKRFVIAAAVAGQALSQQIQFTNTSFDHPVSVGYSWPISWTHGNGLPVSLTIGNASWSFPIFNEQPALPSTYNWIVSAPARFVSGDYQLGLTQLNSNSITFSPLFRVDVPLDVQPTYTAATATIPPATNTGIVPVAPVGTGGVSHTTITYLIWDHECGCTQTKTAASPMNTGVIATTSTWYEPACGCTKSAVVPVGSPVVGTNYTSPVNPPIPTDTKVIIPATSTPSSTTAYRGDAVKMSSSFLGLVALLAAAVFA